MSFVLNNDLELDLEGLKSNIAGYEEAGFDGYVAFGCMGEFYALSLDEWQRVVVQSLYRPTLEGNYGG
jgi:dihydrodipicolinate synthase/N-acetylneuraminate lyase